MGQSKTRFDKNRAGPDQGFMDEIVCNYLKRIKLDKKTRLTRICFSPFENLSIIIPQLKDKMQRFFLFFFKMLSLQE